MYNSKSIIINDKLLVFYNIKDILSLIFSLMNKRNIYFLPMLN